MSRDFHIQTHNVEVMGKASAVKIAIIGFLFGGFVMPFIATFGLVIPYLELAKPVLVPGAYVARQFTETTTVPMRVENSDTGQWETIQVEQGSAGPMVWITMVVVNGVLYAGIFWLVHYLRERKRGAATV